MTLGNDALDISNRVIASPDGQLAAFDGRLGTGSSRIFVLNLSTLVVTQLTDYPNEPNASDTSPAWVGSANLAFSSTTQKPKPNACHTPSWRRKRVQEASREIGLPPMKRVTTGSAHIAA